MEEVGRRRWFFYAVRVAIVLVPLALVAGLLLALTVAYLQVYGIALAAVVVGVTMWAWPRRLRTGVYAPLDRRFLHRPA